MPAGPGRPLPRAASSEDTDQPREFRSGDAFNHLVRHSRRAGVFGGPTSSAGAIWQFIATSIRLLARRATIATVSDFSSAANLRLCSIFQLQKYLCSPTAQNTLPPQEKPVARSLDRLGLRASANIFFPNRISMTKNKNISLAIEAGEVRCNVPIVPLVVVGGDDSKMFPGQGDRGGSGRDPRPGRLSDNEIAALYARALAFVFPRASMRDSAYRRWKRYCSDRPGHRLYRRCGARNLR